MSNAPTPRTDKTKYDALELRELSRELERELAECQARAAANEKDAQRYQIKKEIDFAKAVDKTPDLAIPSYQQAWLLSYDAAIDAALRGDGSGK